MSIEWKIVEKEGRYYIPCSDGDIEITSDEFEEQRIHSENVLSFFEKYYERYSHNLWRINEIPREADNYIKLEIFFENLKRVFEKIINEENDKDTALKTLKSSCDSIIQDLRLALKNPFANKNLLEYQIGGYEMLNSFVNTLSKHLSSANTSHNAQSSTQVANQNDNVSTSKKYAFKPRFKRGAISDILDILEGYFSQEHYVELERLLETGEIVPNKLLFLGHGNQLSHAFSDLEWGQFITGCDKAGLETWIMQNFQYHNRGSICNYTKRNLNKNISSEASHCKNKILKVIQEKEGFKIIKLPKNSKSPKKRKY